MCRSQDLVWHAHQLQPSYEDDTVALHGKMLNHDDKRSPSPDVGESARVKGRTSPTIALFCVKRMEGRSQAFT